MRNRWSGLKIIVAVLLVAAGNSHSIMQYTLSDNVSTGSGGYVYNNLYFELAPDPEFSLNASMGRTRYREPAPDTRGSLGFGGWIKLTRKLELAVDYGVYNGAKSQVLKIPDMVFTADKPDRQKVSTLSGTFGLDLMKGFESGGEEEGGSAVRAKLSLGFALAHQLYPVWIERKKVVMKGEWVEEQLKPYEVDDNAYSAGLSLGYGSTTLSTTYKRHHYQYPVPPDAAGRPGIKLILDSILSVTVDALPPFPRYESGVKLRQGLPWRLAATAAYEYILAGRNGEISRYMTGELSWEAFSWMEVRAGSYWDREYQETIRYNTAGVSLYF